MHHIPPFPSLSTTFRSHSKSPSDASNTSSPSPSSSPISLRHSSSHNFLNLSFHSKAQPFKDQEGEINTTRPRPASAIPHGHNFPHAVGVLPCATLRGRSSMMVLRSRPSKTDMVLTEERSRCDGNPIERQGLGLMEPRPIEQGAETQPCVMGGIFEVMEGRA